jgi:Na+/H+-translocating membrane pyrophosphatase
MNKPQHIYLSGVTTGALMGVFASMFAFLLITYTVGDIRQLVNGKEILYLMIFSFLVIGLVVGMVVSMLVHFVTHKNLKK